MHTNTNVQASLLHPKEVVYSQVSKLDSIRLENMFGSHVFVQSRMLAKCSITMQASVVLYLLVK